MHARSWRLFALPAHELSAKQQMAQSLVDAVADEDEERVASLLDGEGKLDVNIESDGWSPLLWAAKRGNAQIMDMLLKAGAFIGATDEGGSTALHKCATNGSIECARLLLDAGASVAVRDKMQQTALDVAGIMGRTECEQLLRQAGARNAKLGVTAKTSDADERWLASQSTSKKRNPEHKSPGETEAADGEVIASMKAKATEVAAAEDDRYNHNDATTDSALRAASCDGGTSYVRQQ